MPFVLGKCHINIAEVVRTHTHKGLDWTLDDWLQELAQTVLVPDLQEQVSEIIAAELSKRNPEDRSEGMNAMGETLSRYLLENNLCEMNSFFFKKKDRRWTWESPDGRSHNEIDFFISKRKGIFRDVTNYKQNNKEKKRYKMITKKKSTKWTNLENIKEFQGYISSTLESNQKKKEMWRNTNTDRQELRTLNKEITKAVRKDIAQINAQLIREIIEHNKNLKVLTRNISKGNPEINKIKNSQLYESQHKHEPDQLPITETKGIRNQKSEDRPDITTEEINYAIQKMKNGRAPGEDGVVIESIKYRLEGLFSRGRWGRVKKGPLATPLEDIFKRKPRARVKDDPC
ncbi:hypothetical protein HUJ04_003197 [Dendroctonus ponderosae]|nr:hypothetical protein HUJ04_003197 [Dendroctonus ponderosae]